MNWAHSDVGILRVLTSAAKGRQEPMNSSQWKIYFSQDSLSSIEMNWNGIKVLKPIHDEFGLNEEIIIVPVEW